MNKVALTSNRCVCRKAVNKVLCSDQHFFKLMLPQNLVLMMGTVLDKRLAAHGHSYFISFNCALTDLYFP